MLIVWGLSYLAMCLEVLSAPGTGMIVEVQGRGGVVRLQADRYAFDWRSGRLRADFVRVSGAAGKTVARARALFVRIPDLFFGTRPKVAVTLQDAVATLERSADGRFAFLDLLPVETKEPSALPFDVHIDRAWIFTIDRTQPNDFRQNLQVAWARVDGVGDVWRAEGRILVEGGGAAVAHVRHEANGSLQIHGVLEGLELARWLGPVRRTKGVQDWRILHDLDARELRARGGFGLTIPKQGDVDFAGVLDAEGRGVRYGDYQGEVVHLRAQVNSRGANGWLEAGNGKARGRFQGQVVWNPEFSAYGKLMAEVAARADVPSLLRSKVPAELNFRNGRYEGILSVDSKQNVAVQGQVSALRTAWKEHIFDSPSATVRADSLQVSARDFQARYRGTLATGSADYLIKEGTVRAFAQTESFPIERFRDRIGDRIQGLASLSAIVSGQIKKPHVELRAAGQAWAVLPESRLAELGTFHALAELEGDLLRVDRLAVSGSSGVATASGVYDLARDRVDGRAVATGIDLNQLLSAEVRGTATGTFRISGTAQAFQVRGPVEVYGFTIAGESIPLLGADVELTRTELIARELRATRGAARVHGEGRWVFESGALSGRFDAEHVQLHDFVEEGIEGSLTLKNGMLAGTFRTPEVTADVIAKGVVLQGLRVDSAEARAHLAGNRVELAQARLGIGNGRLDMDGSYDLQRKAGEFSGQASELPLDRLAVLFPESTGLEGDLSAKLAGTVADGQLASAEARGDLQGITLNGVFLGNGFFSARGSGDIWSGSAEIGQPERFLQLEDIRLDRPGDHLEAQVTALGLPVHDLFRAVRPYLPRDEGTDPSNPSPSGWGASLDRWEGILDLSAKISGRPTHPDLRVDSLVLRNTSMDGEPTGRIEGKGDRKGDMWSIHSLKWTGGPGTLDLRGTVVENGAISLDGNLYNFDTQWIARFLPGLSQYDGDANLFFAVSGSTASPQIEAGLNGSLFEAGLDPAKRDKDKDLKLEIYPILVSEGEISVSGLFNYRGFRGDLNGKIPFRYPLAFPEDREVAISLHVPNRPLAEFEEMFVAIDRRRTDGTVWADLAVTGPPNQLAVNGTLHVTAKQLGFDNADTSLTDVSSQTTFSGGRLRFNASAKSDKGGSLLARASVEFANFEQLLQSRLEDLLDRRIEGSVVLDGFRVEEANLPLDERKESLISTEFSASGGVRMSGPLRQPSISTYVPLAFERVSGEIPSLIVGAGESLTPLVDPRFNIAYVIGTRQEPAEVKAAASQLSLYGAGTLKGRLQDLEADASLRVRKGHLRLPNARVNVQEGGTVRLHWDNGAFDSDLRLDVDIEGRTALSTIRYGNLIERYDIFLELRGNLLDQEELSINARSEPADLSQERILNLLGQIELVEQFANQLTGAQDRRQLERALGAIAIPVLFDPVTEEVARQLGLEYLSLEYGPLGQTNIIAAKWLGKGFSIQGRREISEPLDRIPDYDLRLTYRPPRRIRELRGLTFSVGIDQDRPWKLSVEYGQRFRNSGSNSNAGLIPIGPKLPPPSP